MEQKEKKLYTKPAKALTCILQVIFGVLTIAGAAVLILFAANGGFDSSTADTYTKSASCGEQMYQAIGSLRQNLQNKAKFEEDGKLDTAQVIDISAIEDYRASGQDKGNKETAYTFEQLSGLEDVHPELSEQLANLEIDYGDENFETQMLPETDIDSGTDTPYYSRMSREYLSEYWRRLNYNADSEDTGDGAAKKADMSLEAFLKEADQALYTSDTPTALGTLSFTTQERQLAKKIKELSGKSITSLDDKTIYLYEAGRQAETDNNLETVSGGTLADYAMKHLDSTNLQALYQALVRSAAECRNYYNESDSSYGDISENIRYYIRTGTQKPYTNIEQWKDKSDIYNVKLPGMEPAVWYKGKGGQIADFSAESSAATQYLERSAQTILGRDTSETVYIALDSSFPVHDALYYSARIYDAIRPFADLFVALTIVSAICLLALFVIGTMQSGKNATGGTVRLYAFDRLPTEVFAAITAACVLLPIFGAGMLIDQAWGGLYSTQVQRYDMPMQQYRMPVLILALGLAGVAYALFLIFYYCLVRRIKGRNLWRDSLLKKVFHLLALLFDRCRKLAGRLIRRCKKGMRNIVDAINLKPRLVLFFLLFVLVHLILIGVFTFFGALLCFILDLVLLHFILEDIAGRDKVKEGLSKIADGDIDYQIDTAGLAGESFELAQAVNRIGDGLTEAVNQKMKSERLKSDLITNVSHDIKTPLTSIINYVHLLKREEITDPKIKGYIDVLDAKSQRLRQLTEDLVEASKVSSGNVHLEFMILNFAELIAQMNGEFDERFAAKGLQSVWTPPESSMRIRADSRRLWRVVENLYANIVKYAMPGTRVYIDLMRTDGWIALTIKNISEHPLNIDAADLTERFIRGDVSRSTEGSGLGLSIAQNLTKLMKGTFDIYLDGDLFKVTVCFPEIPEAADSHTDGTAPGDTHTDAGRTAGPTAYGDGAHSADSYTGGAPDGTHTGAARHGTAAHDENGASGF